MRVFISNYRNHWLSPYTILEKVLFWKDWENIDYDTPWVQKWSDRLNPFCVGLQKFLDVINPKINYVKIDYWDTWSMDHTLAHIILPMLKQLKEKKHGSPHVDDDDVPEELKSTSAPPKENEYDIDGKHHDRWDWVMNEMIFAFEKELDEDWDKEFWSGTSDVEWKETEKTFFNPITNKEEKLHEMIQKGNLKCDWDARQKVADRIQNGFRLFGKYYQGLWD